MQVILLERIERLGQMGDVVKVKPGFARNYLLPKKKALRATKDNMNYFEGRRVQLEAVNLEARDEAQAVAAKIEGARVVILRQAGENGQLFGSVTARDLASALTEAGTHIDRSQVTLDRPIKALGLHELRVRLHPEVTAGFVANVARSAEEAELQAAGRDVGERFADEEASESNIETLFEAVPEDMEGDGTEEEPTKD